MTKEHGVAMCIMRKLFPSRQAFLRTVNGGYDVIAETKRREAERRERKERARLEKIKRKETKAEKARQEEINSPRYITGYPRLKANTPEKNNG